MHTIHKKSKSRRQKFKTTRASRYIYRCELGKVCSQHDVAYVDFKDLPRKNASDKVLCDTTFEITSNPKYDGYQRGLALMVQKLFNKKSRYITAHTEARVISEDQKLPKALHKSITRKFQERRVYSSY